MLLLNINKKAYGESIDVVTFELSDIEGQCQGH